MSDAEREEYERYWASIQVRVEPIKQLKTHLFREGCVARVREILAEHGCGLEVKDEYCVVTFPEGSTRKEILPRPHVSERNRITLPDGYELEEVVQRNALYSLLGFPEQDFSDC